MSARCPHCGAPNRGGAACPQCGRPRGGGPTAWQAPEPRVGLPPAAVDTAERPVVRPGAPGSLGPRRALPLLLVGLAGLGGAGLWWTLGSTARTEAPPARPAAALSAAAAPPTTTPPTTTPPATSAAPAPADPAAAPAERVAPPGDPPREAPWPPRFEERDLWLAFEAALAQGAVRGSLDAVDCSRRPCVVYGRLAEGADAVRLLDAPPLAPYGHDRRLMYRWSERAAEAGGQRPLSAHFALAFLPKDLDAATRADLQRSVEDRVAIRRGAAPP